MLRKVVIILFSLLLVILPASFVANVGAASAWTGTYHLEREWVKIWINQNGTIDLLYNISITLDSGDPISFVYVGQPKSDFTVSQAIDQYGYTLTTSEIRSGSDYKVRVNLHSPLMAGQTVWFTLTTNVAHMIWEDMQNPGNVGMQFIPTWWPEAIVLDLRVLIVLPVGVTEDMVGTSVSWDNKLYEGDRLAIYWEKHNLLPNEQYPVDVSFPKEYVQYFDTQPRVHNIDTALSYTTIQMAIDAAETLDGHTIFVEEGTYYEHVFVDKSISLIGENRCNTILDGNETSCVVDIFEEKVSVSGFRIQHGEAGIWAAGVIGSMKPMEVNISNNMITSNGLGLGLCFSHNSTIIDNIVHNNSRGIMLSECLGTVLRRNNLTRNDQNLGVGEYFFVQDIDTTNTVDGKPIYYWVNQHDRQFPADAGYVAAVNSVGITVENLTLRNNGEGVLFANTTHSTIKNVKVYNCDYGVALYSSNHNTIVGNIMSNGEEGIRLQTSNNNVIVSNTMMNNTGYEHEAAGVHLIYHSQGNTIRGNTISSNYCGIRVTLSNGSIIYHNNLVNNTYQVLWQPPELHNLWDNGFEGNYWSNYTGKDLNADGIGDTPYVIDVNNQDSYPLLGTFSDFKVTPEYCVQTICNSSISDFQFNETAICFNVTGENDTIGFCRICIPRALMNETYKVFVNGTEVPCNLLPCFNTIHSYLYFTYNHSTQEVIIIPQFSSFLILPLFMIATLLATIVHRRKHTTAPNS